MESNVFGPNFDGGKPWVVYNEQGEVDEAATAERLAEFQAAVDRHPSQQGAQPGHRIASADIGGEVVRLEIVDSDEPELN